MLLRETMQHPAGFVVVEGAVGIELMTKDPLAEEDVGVSGSTHKIPSVTDEEISILVGHGSETVQVSGSTTNRLGKRRGCRVWGGNSIDVEVEMILISNIYNIKINFMMILTISISNCKCLCFSL
jgi:hypothetical protein